MECWVEVSSRDFFSYENSEGILSLPPYLFSFGTLCREDKFTTSSHHQNLWGCSSLACVLPKLHESSFLAMLFLNNIVLLELSEDFNPWHKFPGLGETVLSFTLKSFHLKSLLTQGRSNMYGAYVCTYIYLFSSFSWFKSLPNNHSWIKNNHWFLFHILR